MKRVALAALFLSAVVLTARAQSVRLNALPAPATAPINGRVVSDETGDPIPNARVMLIRPGPGATVLADGDGRFALTAPPGTVTVAAIKPGFSRREVTATAAEQPIEIRLPRGAAISGRVIDARGDPLVAANITAEDAAKPIGSVFTNTGAAASTYTDDRGEYRLSGLAAGPYVVGVVTMGAPVRQSLPDGGIAMFPSPVRTYYPGTETRGDGQALRLQAGEDRRSIDFAVAHIPQSGIVVASPLAPRPAMSSGVAGGVIRGRIVTTDGRAVPDADVLLVSMARFQPVSAHSGNDGGFEFRELPAGSFRMIAQKVGFSMPGSPMTFGLGPLSAGVAVDLAEGETREKADVTLARWGSIEGYVSDELGDPLQGVSVQLLQVRYQNGRRRLAPAGSASRLTDDHGRFRLFGLAPGQYIVSAAAGDAGSGDVPGYARAYFPGTPNAGEAQFVTLRLSQEVTGIDFAMSRAATATISGTLLNAAGEPSTGGSVRLMPSQRSSSVTSVPVGARLMRDGKFEFPNVPPGQYVIQVDRGRRNSSTEGEFGVLPVAVNGADVTGLVLQTSNGSSIAGHVRFDSFLGASAPVPGQIGITTAAIDPEQSPSAPANADVHPDWAFQIGGVNGPRRLRLERAPAQWVLKEILVDGIDVTDRPLEFGKADQSLADVEVVLTDRLTTVSGIVVDDHGRPAPAAYVIAFSPDRDRWYPASRFVRMSKTGPDGAVTMAGLPPGSYYAAAVARIPADGNDAWQDPAYLESLVPPATAFLLGEGQKQTLELKLRER